MVNGPPCQVCGYPLRWFAEQNAWGCDRCRQMFPVQQQAPQAQGPAQQARTPGGKSKAPLFVIGGLVLVGGIVAIVLATKGGGGAAAGTPRGVVERTLSAMNAGNVNALIDLSGMDKVFATALKCDGDNSDDRRKTAGDELVEFQRRIDKVKGLHLELVAMPDLDKRDKDKDEVIATGSKFSATCTTTAELRMIKPMITVRIKEGDKAHEQTVKFGLLEVADRWYMLDPPKFDAKLTFDDELATVAEFRDRACACKDAACAKKAEADMETWAKDNAKVLASPSDEDMKKAMKLTTELATCVREASGGGGGTATNSAGGMPQECDEWRQRIQNLAMCGKASKQLIDAQQQAYTRSMAAWEKISPEAQAQLAPTCQQLADDVAKMDPCGS